MNITNKNRHSSNWCKIHPPDREVSSTPLVLSKLQKHELEDLYYKLLDDNIELKKTVNEQKIEIKLLSTKVRRMSAIQRQCLVKDTKECCANARVIIEGQNKYIEELQATIECKNEKIRLKNMKLCSTKQFLAKGNISQCTLPSNLANSPYSTKLHTSVAHSTVSTRSAPKVNKTLSQNDLQSKQLMDAETHTDEPERSNIDQECIDNKCATLKEELKQKIEHLVEELTKLNVKYTTRITELESTIAQLQMDNTRERADKLLHENRQLETERNRKQLREELNVVEAQCCELRSELMIEQKRVSELEMQVRSAAMSNEVSRTIELHLANRSKIVEPILQDKLVEPLQFDEPAPRTPESNMTAHSESNLSAASPSSSHKLAKSNDDSGFTDHEVDDKVETKLNSDLLKMISDMQKELNELKSRSAKDFEKTSKSVGLECCNFDVEHSYEDTPKKTNVITGSPKRVFEDNKLNLETSSNPDKESYFVQENTPEQYYEADNNSQEFIASSPKCTIIQQDSIEKDVKPSPVSKNNENRISSLERRKTKRKRSKLRVSCKKIVYNNNTSENDILKNNIGKLDTKILKELKQRLPNLEQSEQDENTVLPNSIPPSCEVDISSNKGIYSQKTRKNSPIPFDIDVIYDTKLVPEATPQPINVPSSRACRQDPEEPLPSERVASPDDTEYEISSIVDTSSDSLTKPRHLSPGEENISSSHTSSTTCDTSSYLSEGEVKDTPTRGKGILSVGEKIVEKDTVMSYKGVEYQPIKAKMDDTLQSISIELARCRQLLRANAQPKVKDMSSVR